MVCTQTNAMRINQGSVNKQIFCASPGGRDYSSPVILGQTAYGLSKWLQAPDPILTPVKSKQRLSSCMTAGR